MSTSANPIRTARRTGSDDAAAAGSRWSAHLTGALDAGVAHPLVRVGEILLLPVLAVLLGLAWAPEDPLQTFGHFPWVWLAPVIVALRYGSVAGLVATSVLVIAWLGLNMDNLGAFPQMYFLGGLILVMLVGEFSSAWRTRARRAEAQQLYLDQRFEHLVHQHYLLRLSHERMGQELIGRPLSMQDAVAALRDAGPDGVGLAGLLRLLAQYCQLDAGALHAVERGVPVQEPAAAIGAYKDLDAADPLVRQALQSRRLCHVNQADVVQEDTLYLVAAPLLDRSGEIYALLVVQDMLFFALHEENLQTLQLLLDYYSDGLSANELAAPLRAQYPDCPVAFAFELQRLAHMQTRAGVDSVIVALELGQPAVQRGLAQQIRDLKRALDETWLLTTDTRQVLAVLMPFGSRAVAQGYIARLESWMRDTSGRTLAAATVVPHVIALDGNHPELALQRVVAVAQDGKDPG